jgi:hypothetical protein
MPSKQVVDRQKLGTAVAATVVAYEKRLRAGIHAALLPTEVDPTPHVEASVAFATAAGGLLVHAAKRMVEADEAHALELADDATVRAARNAAAVQLREHLVALRDAVVGLGGPDAPALIGMPGKTPTDPVALIRYAREAANGLREHPLPSGRGLRMALDAGAEAASLDAEATDLEAKVQAVVDDVRQNQETMTARDSARDVFDRTYSATATLLSALYAFAGEDELADRVRPTVRSARAGGSSEAGEDGGTATPPEVDGAEAAADELTQVG